MNVVERAQDGYGKSAIHLKSPRDVEYEAIAKISHRLKSAFIKRSQDFAAYIEALHNNNSLWTTMAANVAQPDNELPKELRARLFWLAEFTNNETQKLMRGNGDVATLLEINSSILHGLRNTEKTS